MDEQLRSAKAVVELDEVHFIDRDVAGINEPEITQELLDSPENWFSVTTIKASLEVTQDPTSLTKINIDQTDVPIGITTEPGDFNINFNMPDLTDDNLAHWLNKHGDAPKVLKMGNSWGYGYDFRAQLFNLTAALKTKSGEWFIFPNVTGSVHMMQDSNVWLLGFNGQVLAATNKANANVYFLTNHGAAPIEATSISMTAKTGKVGNTVAMAPTIAPTGAAVTYLSSDKSVATVDSEGHVYCIKEGVADITCSAVVGNQSATAKITITAQ